MKNRLNVNDESLGGCTLLHIAAQIWTSKSPAQELYPVIIQKLVKKGCPINKLGFMGCAALGHFYYNDIDESWWKCRSSVPFIENGAQLMVTDNEKRWNILNTALSDLQFFYGHFSNLSFWRFMGTEKFGAYEKIVKDALYTKFKYDYENGDEHIDPTAHIEETLQNAWNTQYPYAPTSLKSKIDGQLIDYEKDEMVPCIHNILEALEIIIMK